MVNYKKFPEEYIVINEILKSWNPIGVEEPCLSDEYIGYIPTIMRVRHDMNLLVKYLEDILINQIGVSYDPCNERHKQDVWLVANKIHSTLADKQSL